MPTINFTVEGHNILVDNLTELAQESNNFDTCAFTFDSSWDGFTLYAVMYQDPKNVFKKRLDNENKCKIPAEKLKKSGWLYIGARGEKADQTVATTIMFKIRVRNGAVDGTETGQEVLNESQYEHLLGEINKLKDDLSQLSEEIGKQTGTGLSTEAIDKLEEVGNYLAYTTADGGSKWTELISILRNGSSGGGSGETVPATGISLDKTTLSFTDSATQTLTATVEPSNSTDKVTWESSNTGIATVSGGVVTPVSNGSCTITAKAGSYSASCEVTVAVESEIVTYTITNNLTNVSTDNPVTTITKNSPYEANLTPDTDHEFDSVIVTMGGTDITAIAYSNGAITIGSTTGNIVITASAVETASEEVVLLKSITGDGNSYIDTEFIPTDGVKYQIGLRLNSDIDTSVKQYLWGADQYTSNESGSYHQLLMYTQNNDNAKYGYWCISDRGTYPQFTILAQSTDFTTQPGYFQCMLNENTISQQLYIDEDYTTAPLQGQWDKSVTYTGNKVYPIIPIYLFWVNRASGAFANERTYTKQKYTLYHFRIYDIVTDSLLHEFLPAKQGTKIGVYDTVTQKFHENKGTGTFGYEEVDA